MPNKKTRAKFGKRGRQRLFARWVGVRESTVSEWLNGKLHSPRLDRMAKDWRPNVPAQNPEPAPIAMADRAI